MALLSLPVVRFEASKSMSVRLTVRFKESQMKSLFARFVREEAGQDIIEYALLAAFISIVAILTIRNIGPLINAIYQRVQAALT